MDHKSCPYGSYPAQSFWRKAVANAELVSPRGARPFNIGADDLVATAGSCFAQHIARYMARAAIRPYVVEPAPPPLDADTAREYQYGVYSARYGNIYTARQLLQMFKRAFETFKPIATAWEAEGKYVDPCRPSIHPGGYASTDELEDDRQFHLAAVRTMFESLDVFVFTLGLTEAWVDRRDGLVYPVCPGCGWGRFDETLHSFANFTVQEVADDLATFIELLGNVNARARVILTVSPVPLVATATGRHVLESTIYSKSVLRVAAEMASARFPNVSYFPSFEIITGPHSRGRYYEEDLRSVAAEGVDHVMRVFFETYLPGVPFGGSDARPASGASDAKSDLGAQLAQVICEEEQLDA